LTNCNFPDKNIYTLHKEKMSNIFFDQQMSFYKRLGRKTIVTGHYGSGKTEFAVSLAMILAKHCSPLAIIDLDIVNPYFRSQERRELLEEAGIAVYGSMYKSMITAELPALSANSRAPLENDSCRVIIDAGGNDTGALVLNQFSKYFKDNETKVLTVVNVNRPETSNIKNILEHIISIENITKLTVSGIVNNTHMLRETTAADIIYGHKLCLKVCGETGKSLLCDCYPEGIINPNELKEFSKNLMPLGLYMRPTWLDK